MDTMLYSPKLRTCQQYSVRQLATLPHRRTCTVDCKVTSHPPAPALPFASVHTTGLSQRLPLQVVRGSIPFRVNLDRLIKHSYT
eukprot:1790365-Rhodomonas_salina.3